MLKAFTSYYSALKVRNIGLLTLMTFFYSLTFYTTTYSLFLTERGLRYVDIFLMESILSVSILLFEVPSGKLADRIGRRKLIILAVSLFALSTSIIAWSHSFFWFAVQSALYGFGVAAMSGTDSALIYESLQEQHKVEYSDYAYSLTSAAATLAMIICLPVGGWLAGISLDLPVYVSVGSMSLAIMASCFLKETKLPDHRATTRPDKPSLLSVLQTHPYLVFLQCLHSTASVCVFSLLYLNQPYFQSLDLPIRSFGLIMLMVYVLSTGTLLVAPVLKKRWPIGRIFFLTTLLPGGFFILMAFSPTVLLSLFAFTGILVIHSVKGPLFRTYLQQHMNDFSRVTTLSVISLAGSLIGVFMKPLIGFLADRHLLTALATLGTLLLVLSFIFPIVFFQHKKHSVAQPKADLE